MARSIFADLQKMRAQEDPGKIPAGAMPRTIDVILRNEAVEVGKPGDVCDFIGYLCALPEVFSMIKPGEKTQISVRSN